MQDQCVHEFLIVDILRDAGNDWNGLSAVDNERIAVLIRWWLHDEGKVLDFVEKWTCQLSSPARELRDAQQDQGKALTLMWKILSKPAAGYLKLNSRKVLQFKPSQRKMK